MKRLLTAILIIAVILSLAACGQGGAQPTPEAPGVAPVSDEGVWTGLGGCFKLEFLDDNDSYRMCRFGEGLAFMSLTEDFRYRVSDGEGKLLFEGSVKGLAPGPDSIWLSAWAGGGQDGDILLRLSRDGTELVRTSLADATRHLASDAAGNAYAVVDSRVCVYAPDGTALGAVDSGEDGYISVLAGGDGRVWLFGADEGAYVAPIDPDNFALGEKYDVPEGAGGLMTGNERGVFLYDSGPALTLWTPQTGEESIILVWSECAVTSADISNIIPDGDGYLCLSSGRLARISPAEPGEVKPRKLLTLCDCGPPSAFGPAVSAFNAASDEYFVEIVYYSGDFDQAALITRLNTELITGVGPDMISFTDISPSVYAAKGALIDLYPFMDEEPDLSREDFWALDAFETGGALYSVAARVYIESRYGFTETVGDRLRWSWEDYFAIEDTLPAGSVMLDYAPGWVFIESSLESYWPYAIDWEAGTCAFDTPEFIRILEAAKRGYDPTAPDENMNLVYESRERFSQGKVILTLSGIMSPEDFATPEKRYGRQVSFIGWPTPDGSCGTVLDPIERVGVNSSTEYPEGCWEFIKHMLLNTRSGFGLPLYRPTLDANVARTLESETVDGVEQEPLMTEEQAKRLYELLDAIELVRDMNTIVRDIVMDEAAAYFAGDRSVEDCAARIQSRVSIYLAEQAG